MNQEYQELLELSPVIPAVHESGFSAALSSDAEIIFLLEGDVMSVGDSIQRAHNRKKKIFIHIDLMKGIGKDRHGVEYLARLGADGIISTHASLIRNARELGIVTIQRYFALDSRGLESMKEMIESTKPDFVEIMPGVIEKVIRRFASNQTLVIAGGLLETKAEVMAALSCGAVAVSTGKKELWSL